MSETIVVRVEDDNPIRITVTDVVRIEGGGGGGAVDSVNGQTGVVVLTKADVGLGAVDNTSDANKPVSSATATALSGKAATVHTHAIADTTGLQAALDGKQAAGSYAAASHTHTASQVTDLEEAVEDYIGANVVGTGLISASYNDTSGNTTISTTATANSSDATLLARANHTGTQSADTLTDGTTNKAFLATERTKLSGIATGATANSADATLLARANHTGTQTASTISDFSTAADARVNALVPSASETVVGKVELATAAETTTGTDTTRAVHPAGVKAVADTKAALSHTHAATDITSGTVATARLGSGTASAATFLRGDQTWATPAGGSGTNEPQFATGRYYGAWHTFAGTNDSFPMVSGRFYVVPFLVGEATPFDRIAITVMTAGQAGSVIRLGVYTSSRQVPTTLVFDAGTVAADSTGQKVVTISQTLQPGFYWVGGVSNDASGTLRVRATDSSGSVRRMNMGHPAADWAETVAGWYFTGYTATSALPGTASLTGQTAGNGATNDLVHITLRGA